MFSVNDYSKPPYTCHAIKYLITMVTSVNDCVCWDKTDFTFHLVVRLGANFGLSLKTDPKNEVTHRV